MPATNQDFSVPRGADLVLSVDVDPDTRTLSGLTVRWALYPIVDGIPNRDGVLVSKTSAGAGGVTVTSEAEQKFDVDLVGVDTEGLAEGNYFHEAYLDDEVAGTFDVVATGVLTVTPTEGGPLP